MCGISGFCDFSLNYYDKKPFWETILVQMHETLKHRVLEATICKNLFLCTANKKEFYLLMIVGDKRLVTKDVSKKLSTSRLSFANESYMEEYLDITPGSVSVLGLMNDTENHVQLVIDEDVLKGEYVGCHPCINTSSLRVRTADLMEKIIPAMHHEAKIIQI